jgi:hypothetical protein
MLIDQEEMSRRLNSAKNLANVLGVPGVPGVPGKVKDKDDKTKVIEIEKQKNEPAIRNTKLRTIIGALALQGEPIAQIAKDFKVTPQQIKSARDSKVPAVSEPRDRIIERVRDIALDKLMMSMNLLTEDRLQGANVKDIASVAGQMSRVIEKLSPREATNNTQLVIYAPQIRAESQFRSIDV